METNEIKQTRATCKSISTSFNIDVIKNTITIVGNNEKTWELFE